VRAGSTVQFACIPRCLGPGLGPMTSVRQIVAPKVPHCSQPRDQRAPHATAQLMYRLRALFAPFRSNSSPAVVGRGMSVGSAGLSECGRAFRHSCTDCACMATTATLPCRRWHGLLRLLRHHSPPSCTPHSWTASRLPHRPPPFLTPHHWTARRLPHRSPPAWSPHR